MNDFHEALLKLKRHFHTIPKPLKAQYERIMYGIIDNANKDMVFLTTDNSLLKFYILFTCIKEAPLYDSSTFTESDLKQSIIDITIFLKKHDK